MRYRVCKLCLLLYMSTKVECLCGLCHFLAVTGISRVYECLNGAVSLASESSCMTYSHTDFQRCVLSSLTQLSNDGIGTIVTLVFPVSWGKYRWHQGFWHIGSLSHMMWWRASSGPLKWRWGRLGLWCQWPWSWCSHTWWNFPKSHRTNIDDFGIYGTSDDRPQVMKYKEVLL